MNECCFMAIDDFVHLESIIVIIIVFTTVIEAGFHCVCCIFFCSTAGYTQDAPRKRKYKYTEASPVI